MHRIDAPGNVSGMFTEGDPQAGQPPTQVSDDWLNAVQEEVVGVILATGRVLSKPNNGQLADSIYEIAAGLAGFRNSLLNGDFSVNQRSAAGYSITTGTPAYCLDRWLFEPGIANSRTITISQQAFAVGQADVPGDPSHFIRWGYAAGGTNGVANPRLVQRIENVWTLQGRVVRLTFWARVSSGSSTLTPNLRQYFGAAGSAAVDHVGAASTLSTTWTQFAYTFTLGATTGKTFDGQTWLELRLETPKTYDAGVFELADVQLEIGQRSTPFERRPWGEMRRLCERYFETSSYGGTWSSTQDFEAGWCEGVDAHGLQRRFRTPKRATPAVLWYSLVGSVGKISDGGVERTVSNTFGEGPESTGYPEVGSALGGDVFAHWSADAEL